MPRHSIFPWGFKREHLAEEKVMTDESFLFDLVCGYEVDLF